MMDEREKFFRSKLGLMTSFYEVNGRKFDKVLDFENSILVNEEENLALVEVMRRNLELMESEFPGVVMDTKENEGDVRYFYPEDEEGMLGVYFGNDGLRDFFFLGYK